MVRYEQEIQNTHDRDSRLPDVLRNRSRRSSRRQRTPSETGPETPCGTAQHPVFRDSSRIRREVRTAQNSLPHIEQWSSQCSPSENARVLSHRSRARTASRNSLNCASHIENMVRLILNTLKIALSSKIKRKRPRNLTSLRVSPHITLTPPRVSPRITQALTRRLTYGCVHATNLPWGCNAALHSGVPSSSMRART